MTTDRVKLPELRRLAWSEVDPAARPAVDPAEVAKLVRVLPPAAEVPSADADWRLAEFWYDRMTESLVEHLGVWVVGWWYTVTTEDRQDGVIPVWRAQLPAVTTPEETLTRIADAVVAWHKLLIELAADTNGRFAQAAPASTDGPGEPPVWQAVQGNGRTVIVTAGHQGGLPHPRRLSWADTRLQGVDFEVGTVQAVVTELVAATVLPSPGADWRLRDLWLENVSAGLVDRYGRWAAGWRWSVGEGDLDGGPVHSWCCFSHSATTPEATVTAIAAAVVEWRGWLDDVAVTFDRFLPLPAGDIDGWERAVAHLVTWVGDRTRYESGWYECCLTVLGWFLDAAGVESGRRQELLDHAIAGRFDSWVEPPGQVVESVAVELARRLTVEQG